MQVMANVALSSPASRSLSETPKDHFSPLNDHIRSDCLTPPGGIVTPHPNPVDGRLPGISHTSSLGQVRSSLCYRPKLVQSSLGLQVRPSAPSRNLSLSPPRSSGDNGGGLDYAKAQTPLLKRFSPGQDDVTSVDGHHDRSNAHSLSSHERPHSATSLTPPTSPSTISSPSSTSVNICIDKAVDLRSEAASAYSRASSSTLLKPGRLFSRGAGNLQEDRTQQKARPGFLDRRHTYAASSPLTGALSTTVAAAKLSNPVVTSLSSASRPRSGSQPTDELRKLTHGGGDRHPAQNTPPYSPRSQSQDSKRTATTISPSKGSPNSLTDENGPSLPKGKLSVLISEGRDIRPSVDPYVVCQFQWSEYISKGPVNNAFESSGNRKVLGGEKSVIKQTGSDLRRPMAIPTTKSRQNSNASVNDSREAKVGSGGKAINPRWGHEATL